MLSIAAGQAGTVSGDVRDAITLGAQATLDIAAGSAASLFGGVASDSPTMLSVEAGATLFAAGPISATVTLGLGGGGSLLQLAAGTLAGFAATVASMVPGSIIDISGARVTSVTKRTVGTGRYSLILGSDQGVLGTIALGTGPPFLVVPVPDGIDGTRLITGPYLAGPAHAAPPTIAAPDTFTWTGGISDSWAASADWYDASGVATRAPGAGDTVYLNSGTTRLLPVAGAGYAALIATSGDVALAGPLTFDTLLAGTSDADVLVLTANVVLTATSVTLRRGDLSVQGGSLAVAGMLAVSGMLDVINGGKITSRSMLMANATLRLAANSGLSVGTTTSWLPGTLMVGADGAVRGSGTIESGIALGGTLEVSGILSLFGSISGNGTIQLDAGSTLFAVGGLDQTTIKFASATTLELFGGLSGASLVNFGPGDSIELAGSLPGAISWIPHASGGTLDLGPLGSIPVGLAAGLDPAQARFSEALDGFGGTTISEIPCFVSATRLHQPHGSIAAGDVQPGDWLSTASGAARRVIWVGETLVPAWHRAASPQLDPVRVHAGAFGPGRPGSEIALSPLHGVVLDTVSGRRVVPAVALYDGTHITRDRESVSVTYVHIALTKHDAVLAGGLACESFVPYGPDPRGQFRRTLGPRPTPTRQLASRLEHGIPLDMLRKRLGLGASPCATATTSGNADSLENLTLQGWATGARSLHVALDGAVAGFVTCNRWRADLEAAGLNAGHAGFTVKIPHTPVCARLSLQPLPSPGYSALLDSTMASRVIGETRCSPWSAARSGNSPRFSSSAASSV